MAEDQKLADGMGMIIGGDPVLTATLTEKKMFGGLAFLIGGNMAISASGQGGVLVRVDPAETERRTETTGGTGGVMGGRPMTGWLRVGAAEVDADAGLISWVERGTAYARSLPP